jgi:DNA polymerase-3 subunit alpha
MERWYSMVHLHMRSSYSLLESPIRLESMILHQKQLGYNHVCLTDHNVMYGTMEFYCAKSTMYIRLLV